MSKPVSVVVVIAFLVAGVVLLVLMFVLIGCVPTPKPVPPQIVEHTVTVTVHDRCARSAPPDMNIVPEPSCAEPVGPCTYTLDQAAAVADNLERLYQWVGETWSLCRPGPSAPALFGGTP